jgi:hypothetical protein
VQQGIADGSVTLAFRRWRQPHARVGARHRLAVGVIEIEAVDVVDPASIDEEEATRAGAAGRDALVGWLERSDEGAVYRIAFRHAGADPRIALRRSSRLGRGDLAELARRLERLDRASSHGPWTRQVLELIEQRPEVRAADLAESLGRETQLFKRDVRKLKELGLTESLEVGYRISPRGRAWLRHLRTRAPAATGEAAGRVATG